MVEREPSNPGPFFPPILREEQFVDIVITIKRESFEDRSILLKFKKGENIALTLHFVQPQEYSEVFRG